jgi:hypothetical protein
MNRKIAVSVGLLLVLGAVSFGLAWLGRSDAVAQGPAGRAPVLRQGKAYLFSSQNGWLRVVVMEEPRDNWVRARGPAEQGREVPQWINLAHVVRIVEEAAGEAAESGDVKGSVTIDGEAVVKGKVTFYPEIGDPIEAEIKGGGYSATEVPAGTGRVTDDGHTKNGAKDPPSYPEKQRTPSFLFASNSCISFWKSSRCRNGSRSVSVRMLATLR